MYNMEENANFKHSEYIEAGKIITAHSFRGEVKIQGWCDSAEFLTRFKMFYLDNAGSDSLNINNIRIVNDKQKLLIASFHGIDSEESAVKLRNKIIYIKKSDANLSDGTFFISDLTGLPVFDFNDNSKKYGVLTDIFDNGASEIYVVETDVKDKNNKNKEVLIPNVAEFVKNVSLEDGIFISPIEGMFDE